MSCNMEKLAARRQKRISARHAPGALARANAVRLEKAAIITELRALPLKKLRAIHKAARTAFSRPDPDHHQPTP
jgi:hypothetical protein